MALYPRCCAQFTGLRYRIKPPGEDFIEKDNNLGAAENSRDALAKYSWLGLEFDPRLANIRLRIRAGAAQHTSRGVLGA